MARVVQDVQARIDVTGIGLHVAGYSPAAARRLLQRIEAKYSLLATHPEMGELQPQLAPNLRSFHIGSYVIFFRPIDDGIEVVRVLHASRDIEANF